MAIEIERKFLVVNDAWRSQVVATQDIRQGYLSNGALTSVRVRIIAPAQAYLTVKSAEAGLSRTEFEYAIPAEDALAMLPLCEGALIEKTRHIVDAGALKWEIDVFSGLNAGLVIAEIELPRAGADVERPSWIGEEITCEKRYANASLSALPYTRWRRS
ncbi:MAG: CYTH domain-containing protein [Hyphomicrobiaceae bacterium]